MKLKLLPLIALLALMISCSKDDPAPSVENAKLSFDAEEQAVVVPDAMLTSDNQYASEVAMYVMEANGLSSWTAAMSQISGATKSSTEIVAENGRSARTAGAVVVYIFDYDGHQIAYQVKDLSDSWSFELFQQINGKWYKYFYATEKKDKSSGYMSLIDIWSGDGLYSEMARWEWTLNGNEFNFVFVSEPEYKVVLQVNTSTKAGSMDIYYGATDPNQNFYWDLTENITWDSDGSGTWTDYENGEVTGTGTFEP